MKTIPHRKLRNDSSAILEAVSHGETFTVTNRGRIVAYLVPPTASTWEILRAAGKVRHATRRITDALDGMTPVSSGPSTSEVMDELRGT